MKIDDKSVDDADVEALRLEVSDHQRQITGLDLEKDNLEGTAALKKRWWRQSGKAEEQGED